ncbi:MAG: hypothetical protein LBJ10_09490, partial [Clostridiales bacterium]|nr:hypothetical protein [Clostridiales bacterium]
MSIAGLNTAIGAPGAQAGNSAESFGGAGGAYGAGDSIMASGFARELAALLDRRRAAAEAEAVAAAAAAASGGYAENLGAALGVAAGERGEAAGAAAADAQGIRSLFVAALTQGGMALAADRSGSAAADLAARGDAARGGAGGAG